MDNIVTIMKDGNLMKKTNKQSFNNIALIGHMGSGKSTIGKLLAKKLNFYHIDSDRLIEKKYKKTIKEIFTENGENSLGMQKKKQF